MELISLTVYICEQHGLEALCLAGLSAAAESCYDNAASVAR